MSTQHPDNVNLPDWINAGVMAGEAEVRETFYAYSELGCQEQMWDWEGKDVDPNVVRKLIVDYPDFFKEHVIGRDLFLTYRTPNPSVEKPEKKVLIEALESIPRCYDVVKTFYGEKAIPPVFEVILPFTRSHLELLRVASYYSKIIVGKERTRLHEVEELTIEDWVGGFEPKKIEVIPLLEDVDSLSNVAEILSQYIGVLKPAYLRVFLARSDPALNYGLFPSVLLVKLALSKIAKLQRSSGVNIFPIVGVGSLPFRGHLAPGNMKGFLNEYRGVRTVTVQSALKYDFETSQTRKLVQKLNTELGREKLVTMSTAEEDRLLSLIKKLSSSYRERIEKLASLVNFIANYVPKRRARKLHIGLFGYSREVGVVKLPRAIEFTAAMYSIGVPPELVGATSLSTIPDEDWDLLQKYYVNWREDILAASQFLCWQNLNYLMGEEEVFRKVTLRFNLRDVIPEIMKDLQTLEELMGVKLGPKDLEHRKHENISNNILISLANDPSELSRHILEAARIRKSLG